MRKYAHLLIILLLSIVTIFALLRLGNIDISLETLARVKGLWLFLGFVAFYVSVVARGLRWQHILHAMGWRVGSIYAQTLLTAGLFISSVLPARAGDVGRVAMLKQDYKIPVSQGAASIAAERALDVFSVLILAAIGAIWALRGRIPPEALQLIIGVTILFVLGLVGLLAVPSLEAWLRRLGQIMPAKIRPLYQKALDFGFSLIHSLRDLGRKPFALMLIVAESFITWLLDAVIVHFVLLSLNITVPFSVSLASSMLGVLATIVPLMPGALGQYEAGMIGLLTLAGVPPAESTLAALLVRFISLWSFIPISGFITYIFGFSRALSLKGVNPDEKPSVAPSPTPLES
ncbi:MAG TPA: lysylphosphatidylglycerol synthase transmembrane domain-containing protein [Anaerolineae bacterium]|nr:lysylphosphatidylglycerol synthase transmembrane domain-containing protein [Anaerolineae bacterium]